MAPWKKNVISAYIVFHISATLVWLMPSDSLVRANMLPLMTGYMIPMGLWQSWDMFAPNPSNLNMYLHATVTHDDGTTWHFTLPRMDRLGFIGRYEEERYRKYVENVHLDANRVFWPGLARWIALRDRETTGKNAVRIQIYRTWWEVPPPPPDTTQAPQPDWHSFMFYDSKITNGEPV